ncbi:hypothetical protein ACFQUZ_21420 [Plantactinospora sp. GCM10030261]
MSGAGYGRLDVLREAGMDGTAGARFGGWPLVAGGDQRTRELVRQAVRDGRSGDPYADDMIRAWSHRWRRRRWLLPLFTLGCLVATLWTDDLALRIVVLAGVVFTLASAWSAERCHRRVSRHHDGNVGPEC